MTRPTQQDPWLCDIHVYPTNDPVGGEETVVGEDAVESGDEVAYRVSVDIPAGGVTNFFLVRDELPAELDLVEESVAGQPLPWHCAGSVACFAMTPTTPSRNGAVRPFVP